MASLRSVDGEFIAGAALLSCCAGAFVSAVLCDVVDAVFGDVVDTIVVAGVRRIMEGAWSAPKSSATKVASGMCAII